MGNYVQSVKCPQFEMEWKYQRAAPCVNPKVFQKFPSATNWNTDDNERALHFGG